MDDESAIEPPFGDVHEYFDVYNAKHFNGALSGTRVEWSSRMTSCAGLCYMRGVRGRPASRSCTIRLSAPLLSLRPFADTLSTLLHEMIHAHLWLAGAGGAARDGHGPAFLAAAARISAAEAAAGVRITTFHGFGAEAAHVRGHVWRCGGPCRGRAPHYGWVRRATNRPPQPADRWFAEHAATCGGTFVKVAAPGAVAHHRRKPTNARVTTPPGVEVVDLTGSAPDALECPACPRVFSSLSALNDHLDVCLVSVPVYVIE